jgi:hypothetical protein
MNEGDKQMKRIMISILALSLLIAACSPAMGGRSSQEFPAAEPAPVELEMEERAFDDADLAEGEGFGQPASVSDQAANGERLVIKNADLQVVVEDPVVSLDELSRMAERMGGFVVSSNLYQTRLESGAEVPQASITLRVPAERLGEALSEIEAGANRVVSRNESGQDVTQEYTDLQSRLRNLEQAESQLREIMEDARQTEDVLSVYNQLVQVREEIEVIKGRIQYFEQSAAFSAINVNLIADAAVQPLSIGGWQPTGVARAALQALINSLQLLASAAIWLVIYVLPTLVVLLIPLWLLWRGFRSWRRRRKASRPAASPPSPTQS